MIGDDHIDSECDGMIDHIDIPRAAIDRNHELHVERLQFVDEVPFESVPVMRTVGEPIGDFRSALREEFRQHRGRADTVDVVVSEDDDPFPIFNRFSDPCDRSIHPLEKIRVVKLIHDRVEIRILNVGRDAPIREEDIPFVVA